MKKILLMMMMGLMAMSSYGQQALGQRPRVKSPVINADGTVTFTTHRPRGSVLMAILRRFATNVST